VTYSKGATPTIEETNRMLENIRHPENFVPPPPQTKVVRTKETIAAAKECFNLCRQLLNKDIKK